MQSFTISSPREPALWHTHSGQVSKTNTFSLWHTFRENMPKCQGCLCDCSTRCTAHLLSPAQSCPHRKSVCGRVCVWREKRLVKVNPTLQRTNSYRRNKVQHWWLQYESRSEEVNYFYPTWHETKLPTKLYNIKKRPFRMFSTICVLLISPLYLKSHFEWM